MLTGTVSDDERCCLLGQAPPGTSHEGRFSCCVHRCRVASPVMKAARSGRCGYLCKHREPLHNVNTERGAVR